MKNLGLLITLFSFFLLSCGKEINTRTQQATSEENQLNQPQSPQEGEKIPEACTAQYDPVCGQPPMPDCPEGRFCQQSMPQPKTYSNDCQRKQDQAEFISQGQCPDNTL